MDINEIKAGEYQLAADRWDERTSQPGQPFTFVRHRRGDRVRLSEAEAKRLVTAGAVVKPGELERRAAEVARQQYRALLLQMPDDLREELLAMDAAEAVTGEADNSGDETDDGPAVKPPPKAATKELWIEYRTQQNPGVPRAVFEADGVTKEDLQDDDEVAQLLQAQQD